MAETAKQMKVAAKPRKTTAQANLAVVAGARSGTMAAGSEPTETMAVSRDEIERLAHRFWAERGYEDGHAEMDWLRAEQELRSKAS